MKYDSAKISMQGQGIIIKSLKFINFPITTPAFNESQAFTDEEGPDLMYNLGQNFLSYPSQDGNNGWSKLNFH